MVNVSSLLWGGGGGSYYFSTHVIPDTLLKRSSRKINKASPEWFITQFVQLSCFVLLPLLRFSVAQSNNLMIVAIITSSKHVQQIFIHIEYLSKDQKCV